jgi:hypothetical protein
MANRANWLLFVTGLVKQLHNHKTQGFIPFFGVFFEMFVYYGKFLLSAQLTGSSGSATLTRYCTS